MKTTTTYINFSMEDLYGNIKYVELEVTYSIDVEYDELEIENKKVIKVVTPTDVFEPTDEQNDIILELIIDEENNKLLEQLIRDEINAEKLSHERNLAEWRYDLKRS